MIGCDFYQDFVDRANENKVKYSISDVEFSRLDFLGNTDALKDFDICTFGFELSLDVLQTKSKLFKPNALLIIPLSEGKGGQE